MTAKEEIKELRILDGNDSIYDQGDRYVIPLYQRSFAWEEKQLVQLIDDINDVATGARYYIGSLIVARNKNEFEVVDGQQRLTALFLLLNCLGLNPQVTLSFSCRDKSNYTLKNIRNILEKQEGALDTDRFEESLIRGIRILSEDIQKRIKQDEFDTEGFIEKLRRVIIYRIEVPEHTDLNRYFEIMNTRGEQLEQHDILKAKLMSNLSETDGVIFAQIWDACSEMNGYVQMHFPTEERETIFGSEWGSCPSGNWKKYSSVAADSSRNNQESTLDQILSKETLKSTEILSDDEGRIQFESVIEFPYFLLHTLKVFVRINHIKAELPELLDDKKLNDCFMKVIDELASSCDDQESIWQTKESFSRQFVLTLLRTRFFFDKYIIKREYANDSTDGEWSLKELRVSTNRGRKRAYYSNTSLIEKGKWESTNNWRNQTLLMLESAMRVSYTSPKVMHWITELLCWLEKNNAANTKPDRIDGLHVQAEEYMREEIRTKYFQESVQDDGSCNFAWGVNTPHIVFNYLDYCLWYSDREGKRQYQDFKFEYRNSVEHWYPQNPSSGTFDYWDDVDRFGNLCIIQRNVNSKFSNMPPEAKKSTYADMIKKGSIKLRKMAELTKEKAGMPANVRWKEEICRAHEEEMLEILRTECGY